MVDHSLEVTPKAPGEVGPPETITPQEAAKFIGLVKRGLSDDMAATKTGRSCSGLKYYCNNHSALSLRLGDARAHKTLYHMKNLDRVSRTRDVRGFNAAVKASEAMLRANDVRFRKDPDSMTPGGGGITIIVQGSVPAPSGDRFDQGGGVIDAEAVTVLEGRGVEAGGRVATGGSEALPPPASTPSEAAPGDLDETAAAAAAEAKELF